MPVYSVSTVNKHYKVLFLRINGLPFYISAQITVSFDYVSKKLSSFSFHFEATFLFRKKATTRICAKSCCLDIGSLQLCSPWSNNAYHDPCNI